MSVNLSPIQITRDDIAAAVPGALAAAGISGKRLTLELTESAIIHDPDRVAKALKALKAYRRHASRWTISAPASPRSRRCRSCRSTS